MATAYKWQFAGPCRQRLRVPAGHLTVRIRHIRSYRRMAPLEGALSVAGDALPGLEHLDRSARHAHVDRSAARALLSVARGEAFSICRHFRRPIFRRVAKILRNPVQAIPVSPHNV